jgi:hypothetical protein
LILWRLILILMWKGDYAKSKGVKWSCHENWFY